MLEFLPDALQRSAGTKLVPHVYSHARFLQVELCGRQVRSRLGESVLRYTAARRRI